MNIQSFQIWQVLVHAIAATGAVVRIASKKKYFKWWLRQAALRTVALINDA